jgi:cyclopropane fatty-acyl-phospholipid synthase-like methyltransferase
VPTWQPLAVVEVPDPESPEVVYGRMRWNTPLSEDHADLLLDRLDEAPGWEVLDLGCGWGELLIRAAIRASEVHGTGVDNANWAVERGRRLAGERGLSQRVTFVVADASTWTGPSDRVLCIGASHAWGSSVKALKGLRPLARAGGRLVLGDGCWQKPPTPAAAALFGEEVLGLDDLVDSAIQTGWRVLHLSTADQREWDDFESTWRAGRERWLQSYPRGRRFDEVRAKLDNRLRDYMTVYRSVLGFAYLVLAADPRST